MIIGNRDFFPDQLVAEARRDLVALFQSLDIEPSCSASTTPSSGPWKRGSTRRRAPSCFAGIAIASTACSSACRTSATRRAWPTSLRLSALNVPVLVQACPDDLNQLNVQRRRDAFCGKISVCNNLRQYGIPFTLTERHTDRA